MGTPANHGLQPTAAAAHEGAAAAEAEALARLHFGVFVGDTVCFLRRASAAIVAVAVVAVCGKAYASCYDFVVERDYETASAVFLGKAVRSEVVRTGPGPADVETVTTFAVERTWKGPGGRSIRVTSCGGGDIVCTIGIDFSPGRSYLVFADGDRLETSICGAFNAEKSEAALRWLRRKPSRTPG